ncbi:MAG: hypothetical protein H7841_17515 [Magnetospirillum sp. WYHS-4]
MSDTQKNRRLQEAMQSIFARFDGLDDVIDRADAEARHSGLSDREGGALAAFRHLLAAGEIARRWGPQAARLFAEGHAFLNGDDPNGERLTAAGIEIGGRAGSWDEVRRLVRQRIAAAPSPKEETPPAPPAQAGPEERKAQESDPFAKPAAADPLDRDVSTWTPEDAAAVMSHPDYFRTGSATGRTRADKVARYFELHADEPGNAVVDVMSAQGGMRPEELKRPASGLEKFRDEFMKVDDPVDEIALKPVHAWTEDEARQVTDRRMRLQTNDPRSRQLEERETAWYNQVYGEDPAKFDAYGRMIEAKPRTAIPKSPTPAVGADRRPLADGLRRIGRRVVGEAGGKDENLPGAVRTLQAGINLIASLQAEQEAEEAARTDRPYRPAFGTEIAVDGVVGPQTRRALRQALAAQGVGRLEEGMALARFRDLVKHGGLGAAGGLSQAMEKSLAGLFGKAGNGPRPEVEALQRALNEVGAEALGEGEWTPVPEDGRPHDSLGETVDLVVGKAGSDRLVRQLARELGIVA